MKCIVGLGEKGNRGREEKKEILGRGSERGRLLKGSEKDNRSEESVREGKKRGKRGRERGECGTPIPSTFSLTLPPPTISIQTKRLKR